jgi:5-methylcytosine-specific restriction endonuclease McrA
MAQPQRAAKFFVDSRGIVTPKAPPLTSRERRTIFDRDGGVCQLCGRRTRFGGNTVSPFDRVIAGHVDHIFPRSRGGQNNPENLRVLCITCNAQKGAR